MAVQLAASEGLFHRQFRLHVDDIRLAQVRKQLEQRFLQDRHHALAIDATSHFQQHRAFPFDQLHQYAFQPVPDALVGGVAPTFVLLEEALEQSMRQAAEQQGAVGDARNAAAAQPSVVVQHPLVGMVVGLGQAGVGLHFAAGNGTRQTPPAPLRRQRCSWQRCQRQLEAGDLIFLAVQQRVIQQNLRAIGQSLGDARPQRMPTAIVLVNHQHQALAAIEHRPLPSAGGGIDTRQRAGQSNAGVGQVGLFNRRKRGRQIKAQRRQAPPDHLLHRRRDAVRMACCQHMAGFGEGSVVGQRACCFVDQTIRLDLGHAFAASDGPPIEGAGEGASLGEGRPKDRLGFIRLRRVGATLKPRRTAQHPFAQYRYRRTFGWIARRRGPERDVFVSFLDVGQCALPCRAADSRLPGHRLRQLRPNRPFQRA